MAQEALLTVEQSRVIAARDPENLYELHNGKLVKVMVPKLDHILLQRHIARVLEPLTHAYGLLCLESGFRVQPEFDVRRADIALITRVRLAGAPDDFFGAPDLVIEVLSPSNRVSEMDEKENLCLANGGIAFWLVNAAKRTVRVSQAGQVSTYRPGSRIPLTPFGSGSIPVDDLIPTSRALD